MAKIIKVGSQNPTFTSQNKKASFIHTQRNSNEMTNPFKFTNFEGNTLQFADVFEGFKPSFKASKLRMVAASVTGSMNKMKSSFEPIVNFVNRVTGYASSAWNYAKNTSFTAAMNDAATSIKDTSVSTYRAMAGAAVSFKGSKAYRTVADTLNKEIEININLPQIKGLSAIRDGITGMGTEMKSQWANLIAKIPSRTRYTAETPVAELEKAWMDINALEGGIA